MAQDCAICYNKIDGPPSAYDGMFCEHATWFHPHCIKTWLSKSMTCPICRSVTEDPRITEIIASFKEAVNQGNQEQASEIVEDLKNFQYTLCEQYNRRLLTTIWNLGYGFVSISSLLGAYSSFTVDFGAQCGDIMDQMNIPMELGRLLMDMDPVLIKTSETSETSEASECFNNLVALMLFFMHPRYQDNAMIYAQMGVHKKLAYLLMNHDSFLSSETIGNVIVAMSRIIVGSNFAYEGSRGVMTDIAIGILQSGRWCESVRQNAWSMLLADFTPHATSDFNHKFATVWLNDINGLSSECSELALTALIKASPSYLQDFIRYLRTCCDIDLLEIISDLLEPGFFDATLVVCLHTVIKSGGFEDTIRPLSHSQERLWNLCQFAFFDWHCRDLLVAIHRHPSMVNEDTIKDFIEEFVNINHHEVSGNRIDSET